MNPVTGLRSLSARPPSQPHPPQAARPPPSWARNRTPGTSRLERLKPSYAQRFGWSKDEERQWHCRQRQKRWRQRRGRDGESPPEPLGAVQSEASLASVGSSVASTASAANSERLRWCAPGRWVQEPADEGAIIASARRSGLAPTVVAACRAPRVTASSLHLGKTGRESPRSVAVAGALKEAVPRMRDGLDQDSGAWSARIRWPDVWPPALIVHFVVVPAGGRRPAVARHIAPWQRSAPRSRRRSSVAGPTPHQPTGALAPVASGSTSLPTVRGRERAMECPGRSRWAMECPGVPRWGRSRWGGGRWCARRNAPPNRSNVPPRDSSAAAAQRYDTAQKTRVYVV